MKALAQQTAGLGWAALGLVAACASHPDQSSWQLGPGGGASNAGGGSWGTAGAAGGTAGAVADAAGRNEPGGEAGLNGSTVNPDTL